MGDSASPAADISFGSAAAGQQCVLSPAFTFNVAVNSKTKVGRPQPTFMGMLKEKNREVQRDI